MALRRLFGSNRKSNKENVPQKGNCSVLEESSIYARDRTSQIVNPYSVVTAPKQHKGPRSCPGAPISDSRSRDPPFSDRHSQLNCSIRYENLPPQPRRRVESFEGDRRPDGSRHYRSIREDPREHYYSRSNNYETSDEEDDLQAEVKYWKSECSKLDKSRKEWEYRYKEMKNRWRSESEEKDIFRTNYERIRRAYEKVSKDAKMDRHKLTCAISENRTLRTAQQQSHDRIMELEERLARLERPDGCSLSSLNDDDDFSGAGEALCDQNEPCGGEIVNSDTPSISMFHGGNIDAEQDEVRIFRAADSDEEEENEEDTTEDTVETERSMRASPLEMPIVSSSPLLSTRPKLVRSLSDTDIQTTLKEPENPPSVGTLDRLVRDSRLKPVIEAAKHRQRAFAMCSTSDEDDQLYHQQLYEKQLRKKGEVVKYQPPRSQVQAKHFRPRFGNSERKALAEFEYLQDLSSDASGMLSSPDLMQHNPQFFKKNTL